MSFETTHVNYTAIGSVKTFIPNWRATGALALCHYLVCAEKLQRMLRLTRQHYIGSRCHLLFVVIEKFAKPST